MMDERDERIDIIKKQHENDVSFYSTIIIGLTVFALGMMILMLFSMNAMNEAASEYYVSSELMATNEDIKFFEDENGDTWSIEDNLTYEYNVTYVLHIDSEDNSVLEILQEAGVKEVK